MKASTSDRTIRDGLNCRRIHTPLSSWSWTADLPRAA